MKLSIFTPFERVLETQSDKIIIPATIGRYCILPRHRDGVWALNIGILEYLSAENQPAYVGLNAGILTKCDEGLRILTEDAVVADTLSGLAPIVEARFKKISQDEPLARSALARLEAGIMRHMINMEPSHD